MKKMIGLSGVRKAMLGLAAIVLCCSAQVLFAGNNPAPETEQKPETEAPAALDIIQPEGYTIIGNYGTTYGTFEVSPRDYKGTNYKWTIDNGWEATVDNAFFGEFSGKEFHGSFYVTVEYTSGDGEQMVVYRQFTID